MVVRTECYSARMSETNSWTPQLRMTVCPVALLPCIKNYHRTARTSSYHNLDRVPALARYTWQLHGVLTKSMMDNAAIMIRDPDHLDDELRRRDSTF